MSKSYNHNNYFDKKGLKLNLGCGKDTKAGFVNIDFSKRGNTEIDLVANLSLEIPLDNESCKYIYCSHFVEHLDWYDGEKFIRECYRVLEKGGVLRIIFPDFRKIFSAYVNRDDSFFEPFSKHLNEVDFPYYEAVYNEPEKIKKNRISDPPPEWHLSQNPDDRKRLRLRVRKYRSLIEYVDWFVHQYGEHKMLYDEESMKALLQEKGFSNICVSSFNPEMDSASPLRRKISAYFEAIK